MFAEVVNCVFWPPLAILMRIFAKRSAEVWSRFIGKRKVYASVRRSSTKVQAQENIYSILMLTNVTVCGFNLTNLNQNSVRNKRIWNSSWTPCHFFSATKSKSNQTCFTVLRYTKCSIDIRKFSSPSLAMLVHKLLFHHWNSVTCPYTTHWCYHPVQLSNVVCIMHKFFVIIIPPLA